MGNMNDAFATFWNTQSALILLPSRLLPELTQSRTAEVNDEIRTGAGVTFRAGYVAGMEHMHARIINQLKSKGEQDGEPI
jgi:hypothetical protein